MTYGSSVHTRMFNTFVNFKIKFYGVTELYRIFVQVFIILSHPAYTDRSH